MFPITAINIAGPIDGMTVVTVEYQVGIVTRSKFADPDVAADFAEILVQHHGLSPDAFRAEGSL